MRSPMTLCLITTLLAGCLGSGSTRLQTDSGGFTSFRGRAPPEIVSSKRHWVNAGSAVTLERLRGNVVWLQFNFREDCTPLRYHLVKWHGEFAEERLVIIEIDGGRYEEIASVKRSVERQGVKHLVLWDEDGENHARYGVRSWPVAYLLGKDGRVMWEGRPSKAFVPDESEQKVVDKRTRTVLKQLVAQALKEPFKDEIVWR